MPAASGVVRFRAPLTVKAASDVSTSLALSEPVSLMSTWRFVVLVVLAMVQFHGMPDAFTLKLRLVQLVPLLWEYSILTVATLPTLDQFMSRLSYTCQSCPPLGSLT